MNMRWSLTELYPSFESKEFRNDIKKCEEEIFNIKKWSENNLKDIKNLREKLESYIIITNSFYEIFTSLYNFAELSLSVYAKDTNALINIEKLEIMLTELTESNVEFQKWLSSLDNLESIISESNLLEEHRYYLLEIVKHNKYILTEKEERIIAKMKNTGSNAWSKLQELLTSTLLVDIKLDNEDKKLPLSVVRNMAYSPEKEIRKKAFEAELKSYKKIEDSSAACLNGIKGEVIELTKLRGYCSPLEKTLIDSRLDDETLNAMLDAIKDSLPKFHAFFLKKAEILGHKDGLPYYDLYAPIGDIDLKYTYEEAMNFIVSNFRTYSDKLADYAYNAFVNRWIDAEPREGKRDGAFCANLHSIKQSRILANFTGSFNDVVTLAHELGHGYHGFCLEEETYLNSDYPMPIAETASTFCETIIKNVAIEQLDNNTLITVLESDISDSSQAIVDIYSRFLFESELIALRKEGSLSVEKLNEIMIESQKKAYGSGLNHKYLHPYMWICKPHYYDANYNYYNFPYAFGLLFAKGLYAEYLKRGDEFVKEYDRLLSLTGKMDIADIAKIMGINIKSKDFWHNSLKLIEQDIDTFINIR